MSEEDEARSKDEQVKIDELPLTYETIARSARGQGKITPAALKAWSQLRQGDVLRRGTGALHSGPDDDALTG